MFNKRYIQVRMVKDPNELSSTPPPKPQFTVESVRDTIREEAGRLVLAGIGIYAAKVAIDTASEIAINMSRPQIRE